MKLEIASAIFRDLAGGTFVGLDTETPVKLTGGKRNPMQGRVTKRMTGATVMSFTNARTNAYDAMVKRRLAEEGKDAEAFKIGPRQWGERIKGTPFVAHKGEHYLEVIFLQPGTVEYRLDGEPVDASEIGGLPAKREGEQGGLERKVIIRTFKLASILALRALGHAVETRTRPARRDAVTSAKRVETDASIEA